MENKEKRQAEDTFRYLIENFPDYPCGKCKTTVDPIECSKMKTCQRYESFFHRFWNRVQGNYLELRLDQRIQGELMLDRLADELEGSTQS